MVARQGSQRVWHFAHKPPLSGCGDPDRALHETAKALIVQGFTEAQNQNAEYRVGFACGDCGGELSWNIVRPATSISAERSVVEGTRSDVVVDRGPKGPLIIEVVVSHDLEATTKLRYEQAELPVFVVYPEWSTVAALTRAVIADVVINVPPMRCRRCQDAENRRQRELSEAQEWAQSMLRGLQAAAAEPAGAARPTRRPSLAVRQIRSRDLPTGMAASPPERRHPAALGIRPRPARNPGCSAFNSPKAAMWSSPTSARRKKSPSGRTPRRSFTGNSRNVQERRNMP